MADRLHNGELLSAEEQNRALDTKLGLVILGGALAIPVAPLVFIGYQIAKVPGILAALVVGGIIFAIFRELFIRLIILILKIIILGALVFTGGAILWFIIQPILHIK